MESFSAEGALLTKILETGDRALLSKHRLTKRFFFEKVNQSAFTFIVDHIDRFGKVPSLGLLQEGVGEFTPDDGEDDVEALVTAVKEKRLYSDIQKMMKAVQAQTTADPQDGLELLREEVTKLTLAHAAVEAEDISQGGAEVKRRYRLLEKMKGILGIPLPWPRMNKATHGIQKIDFTTFYGPEGTLKTWVLIEIGAYAAEHHNEKPIMFVFEQTKEQIRWRFAARRAHVDYERFQEGRLLPKERKRFFKAMDEMADDNLPFYVHEVESSGKGALIEIEAQTKDYGATLRLIDGMSFLTDSLEWTDFGAGMLALKNMTKRTKIPSIVTHHTNREGYKNKGSKADQSDAGDLALGQTLARYSDHIFRIVRTPQHVENEELMFVSRKVREGKPCKVVIDAIPGKSFAQKFVVGEGGGEIGDGEEME